MFLTSLGYIIIISPLWSRYMKKHSGPVILRRPCLCIFAGITDFRQTGHELHSNRLAHQKQSADFIAPLDLVLTCSFQTRRPSRLWQRPVYEETVVVFLLFSYLVETLSPPLHDAALQSPKTNSFIKGNLVCFHLLVVPFFIFLFLF